MRTPFSAADVRPQGARVAPEQQQDNGGRGLDLPAAAQRDLR